MNDLRNGILDINGFLVTPQTTARELENHFRIKAKRSPIVPDYVFFDLGDQTFFNEGIEFSAKMSFTGEKLDDIELLPQLPDIAVKYDLTAYSSDWLPYYQELRSILDKWIEKQLGEPTRKNERNTSYFFSPFLINTSSYVDDRARDYRVVGGKVTIRYE